MPAQAGGRGLAGEAHGGDGRLHPESLGAAAHVGGEQGPGADGVGQDQGIPAWSPPLRQARRGDQAVDGQPEGESAPSIE